MNKKDTFPKTDFKNYDEFMEMVEALGQHIDEIWDTGDTDKINDFCSFLKENYVDLCGALQFNARNEHPWIPEWFSSVCFTICEYNLNDSADLRQIIWELGGTVDFDDALPMKP